jgi:hypothetical protein
MRFSKPFVPAVALTLIAGVSLAARVDLKDPRRALGREDNIRVDAQITPETISSSAPLNVTYQVENLTQAPIAVADKVIDMSYDDDSRTITLALGAEVPTGSAMPHLVVIAPGEKRVFSRGTLVRVVMSSVRAPWTAVPQFVQIKVSVLRDVMPFAALIEQQRRSTTPPALPNEMFDRWVESTASVYLNAIPVRWTGTRPHITAENNQASGTY